MARASPARTNNVNKFMFEMSSDILTEFDELKMILGWNDKIRRGSFIYTSNKMVVKQ